MSVSRFKDLFAYQLARRIADEIHATCGEWDRFERWSVGMQLVRAADSIGANIAEAFGRNSTADIRRFLYIARGSLFETEHWLDVAIARELIHRPALTEDIQELARVLNGLIRRPGPSA
jgi:four helix bundle protein